jgi:hypothetical protein
MLAQPLLDGRMFVHAVVVGELASSRRQLRCERDGAFESGELATFRRTNQAEEELQLRLSVRSGDVLRRRLEPSY